MVTTTTARAPHICGCPSHQPTRRRKYQPGTCQDCGHSRRVTRIKFWLNGYEMNVCAECIQPYRDRILR